MCRGILRLSFTYSKYQILSKTIEYFVPLEWLIYRPSPQLKGLEQAYSFFIFTVGLFLFGQGLIEFGFLLLSLRSFPRTFLHCVLNLFFTLINLIFMENNSC